jgi:outer membrane protein TolC
MASRINMVKIASSQLLIFLIIYSWNSLSQPIQLAQINDDLSKLLPPLESLIDSALAHDPSVKFRDLQIVVNRNKLKADKSYWMRNLGIQGDVRYGTFNIFSTNTAEGQNPDNIATQENQFNYGVGAFIKFPLIDLLNRKNQISWATAEIEQARSMVEAQKKEIRQLVITRYNELILKHNLLKIKAKYLALIKTNTLMTEQEFQNGIVDISEYSRITGISTNAESDFETARVEFLTAYMMLEEIIGFKLNLVITH